MVFKYNYKISVSKSEISNNLRLNRKMKISILFLWTK